MKSLRGILFMVLSAGVVLTDFPLYLISPAYALDPHKTFSQYHYDVWQTDDGLPHNSITDVLQDGRGYLWLGTYEGLVRFDGENCILFSQENTEGIRNDHITALHEDSEGTLWIGTRGGLTRCQNGKFSTITNDDGLADDVVLSLCEDPGGGLWVGTRNGLSHLAEGTFANYSVNDGLSNSLIWALHADPDGSLWIGTNGGGLNCLRNGIFTALLKKDGLSHTVVRTLYKDRSGSLWIGTAGGGLNRLMEGKLTVYTSREGLSNNLVRALCEDKDGNLWIGTSGGLDRLREGKISSFTAEDGLSSDVIWSVCEDREGNLWIGTGGGGLNRLRDGKFTVYTTREGLTNNFVWTVCEGKGGGLWIGTNGGGLNRLENGEVIAYTSKDGLSNEIVRSIYEDGNGTLWIGTGGGGLNRFENGVFTAYTTHEGLSDNVVYAICEDSQGRLWVGTSDGLNRLEGDKFAVYTTAEGLSDNVIHGIHEDRTGGLWICTNNGLNLLKNGVFIVYSTEQGLSHNRVLTIYEDRQGTLWIGTRGGLNRLWNGEITAYTKRDGLIDDVIFQIVEDSRENLWMSCNKGIFRVRKKEFDDLDNGTIQAVTSIPYGKLDGLKSSECNGGNQPAGWISRDGRIWFPTIKGVAVIDPEKIVINERQPPVVIDLMLVDNEPVPLESENFRVSPGKKKFEFHYTALSLTAPEKVKFKFQLEGFDAGWVDADTRRIAYYTNLSPGNYLFRVVACNNDGVWNLAGAAVSFVVKPFFHQTVLFYVICVGAIGIAGVGGYHLRVKQIRLREKYLECLVDERTRQLSDANRKLERLATMDGLTGVSNRRRFDQFLEEEWKRAVRSQSPLSLLMIDIDFFKAYNDTYGHQAGDRCLQQVAHLFRAMIQRSTDIVARYGGEEFSIILTNTSAAGVAKVAEHLRRQVEDSKIEHRNSPANDYVTVSVGIATIVPKRGDSPASLIAAADRALYGAKQEGRNRIVCAEYAPPVN
ncbi:MAG: diguanylate cyclase [Deltaproteobacteria bacterium]|nr:diguanylate cyclase [Deltaproteobacteria bacterium]